MLEMRDTCEACGVALSNDGAARICSFECTFCPTCAASTQDVCRTVAASSWLARAERPDTAAPNGYAPIPGAVQPVLWDQDSAIATTRSTTGSFRSEYQSTSGAAVARARLNAAYGGTASGCARIQSAEEQRQTLVRRSDDTDVEVHVSCDSTSSAPVPLCPLRRIIRSSRGHMIIVEGQPLESQRRQRVVESLRCDIEVGNADLHVEKILGVHHRDGRASDVLDTQSVGSQHAAQLADEQRGAPWPVWVVGRDQDRCHAVQIALNAQSERLSAAPRAACMKEWGCVKGEMLRVRGVMVAVGARVVSATVIAAG